MASLAVAPAVCAPVELLSCGLTLGIIGSTDESLPRPSMIELCALNVTLLAPNPLASPWASSANFFLSTWLIANSTMNSTMSSVSMSAYVISQRSWLSCSSSCPP